MPTFEKVLIAFKDSFEEDERYTILMTLHGYTIMEWNTSRQNGRARSSAPLRSGCETFCWTISPVTWNIMCNKPLADSERQAIQQQVAEISETLQ